MLYDKFVGPDDNGVFPRPAFFRTGELAADEDRPRLLLAVGKGQGAPLERRRRLEARERQDGGREVDLADRRFDFSRGFAGGRDEQRDADDGIVDRFAVVPRFVLPKFFAVVAGEDYDRIVVALERG